MARDGSGPPTADIPWDSHKITNLGDATAATDALNRQTADARYLPTGTLATDRLVGRDTAGTGAPEALTVGNGLEFTGAGGIGVANDGITYARIQNVTATSRVLGRITSGAGDVEELTPTNLLSLLLTVDGSGSGLDADLLDGSSSAAFATASHSHAASDTTSGTFADARIAQSNVTQHQAALSLATSQVTSGTFADARVAQSNVTQHQAAIKGKNITGKSGVSFTIQSGGTASGGADGDLIGIY